MVAIFYYLALYGLSFAYQALVISICRACLAGRWKRRCGLIFNFFSITNTFVTLMYNNVTSVLLNLFKLCYSTDVFTARKFYNNL